VRQFSLLWDTNAQLIELYFSTGGRKGAEERPWMDAVKEWVELFCSKNGGGGGVGDAEVLSGVKEYLSFSVEKVHKTRGGIRHSSRGEGKQYRCFHPWEKDRKHSHRFPREPELAA